MSQSSHLESSDRIETLDPTRSAATRRSFLRRCAIIGGATLPVLAVGSRAQAFDQLDIFVPSIYQYPHWNRKNFQAIQHHENDHVKFLVQALGTDARPKPTFEHLHKHDVHAFLKLSTVLENTGVGAYLGAAPFINNPAYLSAAGSILTVEARHAGYLNVLGDLPIIPGGASFDSPLTAAQVVAGAGQFIESLNGGPPVSYAQTKSDANDIAILNFALALEYLEAEFYNINVPRFT